MPERSAKGLWEAALGQLQLQVTRPNYETWLRDTVGVSLGDGLFTIAAPSDFAVEWLSTRLHGLIAKTLSGVVLEGSFHLERDRVKSVSVQPRKGRK
jgi:chromosomal replication initiator protein